MPTTVKCPTCQTAVVWSQESPFRPFCSKRCQLIDLGEWSEENHTISTPMQPNELNEENAQALIEDIEAALARQQDDFFKH